MDLNYVQVVYAERKCVVALPKECHPAELRRLLAAVLLPEAGARAVPVGLLLADDSTLLPLSCECFNGVSDCRFCAAAAFSHSHVLELCVCVCVCGCLFVSLSPPSAACQDTSLLSHTATLLVSDFQDGDAGQCTVDVVSVSSRHVLTCGCCCFSVVFTFCCPCRPWLFLFSCVCVCVCFCGADAPASGTGVSAAASEAAHSSAANEVADGFLTSFIKALASKDYIDARTAALLRESLQVHSHRARFHALYRSYIDGDIDVLGLRDELIALSVALDLPPLAPDAQGELYEYIGTIHSAGFLNEEETSMLRARIAAGDPRLTAVFNEACAHRDSSRLHRDVMDVVRASHKSHLNDRTSDDDDDDDDDNDGGYATSSDDDDDDDDDDAATASTTSDDRRRAAAMRGQSGRRPTNPTPEANELMRIVEGLLDDGAITHDDYEVLRELIVAENKFVMAAFEVYEQDDDHDEDELQDTLVRIAKLSRDSNATDFAASAPAAATAGAGAGAGVGAASTGGANQLRQRLAGVKSLPSDWPTGELAEDVSTAHAALIAEMRAQGKLSAEDVTMLRRLLAVRDNAVRAAWYTYTVTLDRLDLERTLLGIVAREAAAASGGPTQDQMLAMVEYQFAVGRISPAETDQLMNLVVAGHSVTLAAFEAYSVDGDVEELMDTLKLAVRHASSPAPTSHRLLLQVTTDLHEAAVLDDAEATALRTLIGDEDPRVMAARDVYGADGSRQNLADTLARIARFAVASSEFASKYEQDVDGAGAAAGAGAAGRAGASAPAAAPQPISAKRFFTSDAEQEDVAELIASAMRSDDATRDLVPTLVALASDGDPSVASAVEVFHETGDAADFQDTLTRIARHRLRPRATAAAATNGGSGSASTSAAPELHRTALDAIAQLDVPEAARARLVAAADQGNRMVLAAAEVYATDGDAEELADTLTRLASRLPTSAPSPRLANVPRLLSDLVARGELSSEEFTAALRMYRSDDPRFTDALMASKDDPPAESPRRLAERILSLL